MIVLLITKTVMMGWNPQNRERYVEAGYVFTKWFDEFEVDIHLLPSYRNDVLTLKCDYCGEEFKPRLKKYLKEQYQHITGKHACAKCNSIRESEKYKCKTENNNKNKDDIGVIHNIKINDNDIKIKKCKTCFSYKEIDCFDTENITECMECEYRLRDSRKLAVGVYNAIQRTRHLYNDITQEKLDEMYNHFEGKCALTESSKFIMEHFIPHSWNHGGTYLGNLYLLDHDLNINKGKKNPIKWLDETVENGIVSEEKAKELIKYLAKHSELSVTDFKKFIKWCEKNKRTKEQASSDHRTSIEIWREYEDRKIVEHDKIKEENKIKNMNKGKSKENAMKTKEEVEKYIRQKNNSMKDNKDTDTVKRKSKQIRLL